ncbi:MAG TPA: tyrosine--tRNA ligase [Solirubrobacteraceae bacterium]|jgi:tyrosyl-tRNA synthetase
MSNAPDEAAELAVALARNAVDSLPEGALAAKLRTAHAEDRPLRVKLGIDPTAPDIHLGHAVVLGKLREFQDAGHVVVLIVGDYTALVGDPSGRSSLRPMLSKEQIEANAKTFQEQASRILDPDPERLEVRRNGEWLDMALTELLALVRTTTVAQLLERDDFAKRWVAKEPISVLELLYPLLQGYDSVAVRADLELGGTDQKFNLLLGRDIQRAYGLPEQAIMTMPILVGTDGHRKMSKSLGNQIGVTDEPGEMYGKTLSIPDEATAEYYRLLVSTGARSRLGPGELSPRDAKRALAREIVAWLYSEAAALRAEQEFDRVHIEHAAPEQIEEASFSTGEDGQVHLPGLIADAFGISRSEARRLIDQGAATLGGEPLGKGEHDVSAERAEGQVLKVGKRRFRRLRAG